MIADGDYVFLPAQIACHRIRLSAPSASGYLVVDNDYHLQ
jgi:hypothetical protein